MSCNMFCSYVGCRVGFWFGSCAQGTNCSSFKTKREFLHVWRRYWGVISGPDIVDIREAIMEDIVRLSLDNYTELSGPIVR